MEQPPEYIFASIDNCFDNSIVFYFRILRWDFILMVIFAILHLPQLIFCITENSIFNQFQLQLETFTVPNIDISNETAFLIGVLGDAIGTLLYFLSLIYLRQKQMDFHQLQLIQKIYVPFFNLIHMKYIQFHYEEQSIQREIDQIRKEKVRSIFQEIIISRYVRKTRFHQSLTDELKDITKELSQKFNIFLASDDLESIKAFVVFKSKVDRDLFYEKYNQDCLVRNGGLLRKKQCLTIILLAPLIVFENMALKNARNNTVKCTEYCLDNDFTRTAYYIITGFWIFIADILGWIFLELIINKEKQIYLVQEQKVILIRIIVYLICYTLLVPILIHGKQLEILYQSFKVIHQQKNDQFLENGLLIMD
ncbi:unnamed protein product [Paramecium primaurelia]|uniref:Uncharacterized protein n=1 Tax=Paramecium primaurelia TaxID=5886 RepID=A0A8S1NCI4_PARPR|nr:unnamed protein product [Paramecium primaurelia]